MNRPAHGVTFGLAFALWTVVPSMNILGLAASALGGVLILNVLARLGRPASGLPAGRRWLILVLGIGVAAGRMMSGGTGVDQWSALTGHVSVLRERLGNEGDFLVRPDWIPDDRVTRVIVRNSGAGSIDWQLSPSVTLKGTPLGPGTFAFDVDPSALTWPDEVRGSFDTVFASEGVRTDWKLRFVRQSRRLRSLRLSPDGQSLAAVCRESGELIVQQPGRPLPAKLVVPTGPTDVHWTEEGRSLVIGRAGRGGLVTVKVFEGRGMSGGAVSFWPAGATLRDRGHDGCLDTSSDGRLVAALVDGTDDELQVHDVLTGDCHGRAGFGGRARRILFGRDSSELFVELERPAEVRRLFIDKRAIYESDGLLLSRPVFAWTLASGRLFIASSGHAAGGAHLEGNHFVEDTLIRVDPATMQVDLVRPVFRRPPDGVLGPVKGEAQGPVAMSASPAGIAVLFAGSRNIGFFDSELEPRRWLATGDIEDSWPAEFVLMGGRAVVSFPAIGVMSSGNEFRYTVRPAWWSDASRRRGEDLFYIGSRAGISCHSCHPFGGSDNARHHLGGRIRDHITLPVFGLAGTAPFLRDASKARLGDLHKVLDRTYGGALQNVSPDPGRDLEAFLASLPPRTNPKPLSDVSRGAQAFRKARCDACHVPPLYTDQSRWPASYLFPEDWRGRPRTTLDVPDLHHLSGRAPFFIDGRAPTLDSALWDRRETSRHGRVDLLTREEFEALLAFLESL